jgi:hypothetical protein
MNNLLIEKSPNTPTIYFDDEKNIFTLSGKSFPEHAINFYSNVEEILLNLLKNNKLTISFELEYINTSSSKCIYNILRKIDLTKNVETIIWGYEEDDEDLKELGEYYSEALNLNFTFKTVVIS